MAKRKKKLSHSPRAKRLGKRAGAYQQKLKTLRSIMGGFDAKKFDTLERSKPKTKKGQATRRKAMQRVARTFERVKPYVTRAYKVVRTKDKKKLESLRKYIGVTKFKRLRAIPLPTGAKRVTVRFDKRGSPLIRLDGVGEKIYRFPHMPRSRSIGKGKKRKWIDAHTDALAMLDDMLPNMREGIYVLMTRHQFLLPMAGDKGSLRSLVNDLYNGYGNSPDFLASFFGFKFMTESEETFFEMRAAMRSERSRRIDQRKQQRIALALKEIIVMDRQLKGGAPLSKGQVTRRAKLVRVGEPSKKLPPLSERARKTGRR